MVHSTKTLGQYSCSKIAKENVDVFNDAWASQINDLSVLVKDVNDACQGKTDRQVYLSLPRPGVSDPAQFSLSTFRFAAVDGRVVRNPAEHALFSTHDPYRCAAFSRLVVVFYDRRSLDCLESGSSDFSRFANYFLFFQVPRRNGDKKNGENRGFVVFRNSVIVTL